MKVQNFKNLTKVCAKVLEVMFFTCSIVMIAATVYSFARGQKFQFRMHRETVLWLREGFLPLQEF